MTNCYSYLLFVLLLTHWIDAASIRSFSRLSSKWPLDRQDSLSVVNNEVITPEPILFRRRPPLNSNERQRRWSIDGDEDEIEIPIDENNQSTATKVLNPLLRQDVMEINQTNESTTISANEEISNIEQNENSTTSIDINSINTTQISQEVSNESISDNPTTSNETETVTNSISVNQTIEETSTITQIELETTTDSKQDTAIILLDYVTIPPVINDDNQTSISESNNTILDEVINTSTAIMSTTNIQEETDNSTVVSNTTENNTEVTNQGIDNTTIVSDTTENNTEVTDQGIDSTTIISDISSNETSTIVIDEEEYSNETESFSPKVPENPICDRSCECAKECRYGFEILNDTCQCDPPCKNYQCFGNDTCIVTDNEQPFCQPEEGNEHDRPTQCYQPRDAGYHDTDVRYQERWYYNPDQDTCHLFVYRGLGGNKNNFPTLNECHLECITCAPAPDRGTCLGYIRMWYYDYKKNQCAQFQYSGCKGNENKFLREKDCTDTCITRILNL